MSAPAPAPAAPTLTVCILGCNMAARLRPLLEQSSAIATEIVYVDSGSRDESETLVRGFPKARWFSRALDGNFARQRNFALDQARSEWVLFLDTDELLGPHLVELLPELLRSPFGGFLIPTYWLAGEHPPRYVRAPRLYPDRHLRLFRRRPAARFDEARALHERIPPESCQPVFRLKRSHLLHFSFQWLDRAAREAKVARYDQIQRAGVSQVYLYEDLPHRLVRCREHWGANGPPVRNALDLAWEKLRLRWAVWRAGTPPA